MDKRYKGKKRVKPTKKNPKGKQASGDYEGHEPLIKGDKTLESVAAPVDRNNWNRADMTLARMIGNKGISRQKVRIK